MVRIAQEIERWGLLAPGEHVIATVGVALPAHTVQAPGSWWPAAAGGLGVGIAGALGGRPSLLTVTLLGALGGGLGAGAASAMASRRARRDPPRPDVSIATRIWALAASERQLFVGSFSGRLVDGARSIEAVPLAAVSGVDRADVKVLGLTKSYRLTIHFADGRPPISVELAAEPRRLERLLAALGQASKAA